MQISEKELLSNRLLAWIVEQASPEAAVQAVHRLKGGISSLVHAVTLREGERTAEWVLRRFDNAEWLRQEPDLPRHEAHSLRLAAEAAVPTPQVIAWDETGSMTGMPALLMTKLKGDVVLLPESMASWIAGLAEALAKIHQVRADEFAWAYFTYQQLETLEAPGWTNRPDVWRAVVDQVRGPRPAYRECFIHRDYHPNNVLWEEGRVSGVVDWVNACRGPAGVDVGHCRVNLAQLHGLEAADAFLSAYSMYAGEAFQYDPYWDLVSLTDILFGPPSVYEGWTELGVTGLTDRLIMERLDDYAASLIERCGRGSLR
ncbi:Predicted kinase, aminoglycoside phosphotransferase (APT) family [Paenibacillus sp. UNCCL117]|uniref:phosphotransferase family protein n=1 Tax=unclassified Paenibacillus TaxID=185978 RepID=UPI00088937AD|nr:MULTISPECIES: aminoglycoside phosphotransferase family protein [unclassified Paenibacillus]SDD39759.1 Predicted kinase, aminoglycoside phosphotransferase (APT) family [Paenibacillus sp. cl123]SFW48286.1 Predicted kinase, aminoglycoside phosphotransferase (APT) family [Paenibacillus sp. UNCCL117]